MKIAVPIKMVPDLVEDLTIDSTGTQLDATFMRMIVNELGEHAIEQAILLKEAAGADVTILAPDTDGAEDALFSAAAKGADRLIKLTGFAGQTVNSHSLARAFASVLEGLEPDLVLIGVQAHDSLDGAIGPLLAELLGIPYLGYVAGVSLSEGNCTARKEYPGGLSASMDVTLPAVLGIQAAESPPRYVAISRVRQAMKTATIDEMAAPAPSLEGGPTIGRLVLPEGGKRATMLEGDTDEVADKILDLIKEHGAI
jgi:electron transfer flavoprotein beta subunit